MIGLLGLRAGLDPFEVGVDRLLLLLLALELVLQVHMAVINILPQVLDPFIDGVDLHGLSFLLGVVG